MNERTASLPLIISLKPESHIIAQQLAAEQSTPQKRKRVYLNTLAVYAVHIYLQWMEFETDVSAGDSWNPFLCGLLDTADLVLPGIGRLECRPVVSKETAMVVPMEVAEDLIGYVAVQFEERLNEVKLLGFAPAVDTSELPEQLLIADLQPINELIDQLEQLQSGKASLRAFLESGDDSVDVWARESEEAAAVWVREQLETEGLSIIIARLNRTYRTSPEYEWRSNWEKILAGGVTAGRAERGATDIDEDTDIKLQNLVESWLERLAEIWGEHD